MPRGHNKKWSKDPTAVVAYRLPNRQVFMRGLRKAGFFIRDIDDTYREPHFPDHTIMVYFQNGELAHAAQQALENLEVLESKHIRLIKADPKYQNRKCTDADQTIGYGAVPEKDIIRQAMLDAFKDFAKHGDPDYEDTEAAKETMGPKESTQP